MKIPVSHGHLEAVVRGPPGIPRGGAVFCHPHPLYGGTMHTKAVYRAANALTELGLRTVRFNFRGVGISTGTFDEGFGEEEDVRTILDWLAGELGDVPLIAGGHSFGSMVGLGVGVSDPRVEGMLAIGAPVQHYDYSYLSTTEKPVLFVQGEHDEFGTPQEVRDAVDHLGDHVTVREIPGAGHLFEGHFEELAETIVGHFSDGPGARALNRPARYRGGE